MRDPCIYILTDHFRGTLYVGVTASPYKRMHEHIHPIYKGFTAKYHLDQLVYYEKFMNMNEAIRREKQIKGWSRIKKIKLIESVNPDWNSYTSNFIS
jgi:predicted GIY-YIG superfamily endonuclease